MSLLSYNCQGRSNQCAVGKLKKLLNKSTHDLVFFMETKRSEFEMEAVKTQLHFPESFFC